MIKSEQLELEFFLNDFEQNCNSIIDDVLNNVGILNLNDNHDHERKTIVTNEIIDYWQKHGPKDKYSFPLLDKYKKIINWEAFLCNAISVVAYEVQQFNHLIITIIDKYIEFINFEKLSTMASSNKFIFTTKVLERYKDKFDWYWVSFYRNFTREELKLFKNQIDWNHYASGNHNIPPDIIWKYRDYLPIDSILYTHKMNEQFKNKLKRYLKRKSDRNFLNHIDISA